MTSSTPDPRLITWIQSTLQPHHMASLASLTGFSVTGADAVTFLQGQLTHDVKALATGHHQRTGYCTPKGRLLGVMLQWKTADGVVHHLLPKAIQDTLQKRLKMFVLRAKAVLSPPEEGPAVFALWGPAPDLAVGETQTLDGSTSAAGSATLLRLEDCPVMGPRALLVVPQAQAPLITPDALNAAPLPEAAWRFSEIQCGLPWVWKETQEAFVPQMINLELVNGVSFTKGCYPGQEIVARSQYLGKLKRRTFRVDLAADQTSTADPIAPGTEVWSGQDPAQPCGQVVDAAPCFDASGKQGAGAVLLIECTHDAFEANQLHLGALSGPTLHKALLPYAFS
jgi:tRNA-modifying protein YgfZ